MTKPPSFGALIEILKSAPKKPDPKHWKDLEEHVQKVYQSLLQLQDERAVVARNALIQGRDGAAYQIDVYYEFERADIRHRVAIECKNTKRPVERKDVLAFKATMDDCLGMQGVMVAVNGFQQGAQDFAVKNGIRAITLDELPTLSNLLGRRLESVMMPSEEAVGSPFWSIYHEETFAPYSQTLAQRRCAVLFYSRSQAKEFMARHRVPDDWCVRGLTIKNLATLILTVDSLRGKYNLAFPSHLQPDPQRGIAFSEIARDELIRCYCSDCGLPKEPMVALGA
ncbi:restriction endonuclease [Pseudomonas sp. R3-56]|uniref:restriction endonuclease n=1 Tax=Pseudomonas sp. R3-56 TaxID=2817401 RepID=UPI003DAA435C